MAGTSGPPFAFGWAKALFMRHSLPSTGHVLSSGVNCRCDSPRSIDLQISSDRFVRSGSSGTCSVSVGPLSASAMVLSVGAAA